MYSPNFKEHIGHVEEVMIRLPRAQLTAKPIKHYDVRKDVRSFIGLVILLKISFLFL